MIAMNTALEGIQRAETGFNRAAEKIASPTPSESMPTDVVNLLQSRTDFEANLRVAEVSDQMAKATLDLLA